MTFEEIFDARIVLSGALRHLAQAHGTYRNGALIFRDGAAGEAFVLVCGLLSQLQLEFRKKQEVDV